MGSPQLCPDSSCAAYWPHAAKLRPHCVFKPEDTKYLAKGVKELVKANSTLTIHGSGHAPITGITGTNHRVLIATTNFRKIEMITNTSDFGSAYAKVGAGPRWGEIYDFRAHMVLLPLEVAFGRSALAPFWEPE